MIKLFNQDNMEFETELESVDLIYADYIYGDKNIEPWMDKYWKFLKKNGIFIAQTDDSTIAEAKLYLDKISDGNKVNICIYKQEWGGVPKKGFSSKHDYLLIYSKGKDFKWYGDRIKIPKRTAGTAFDKKGTGLKTPCSVFDDLGNFSTMSNERIKKLDGHNISWQKPYKLMDRILKPFTDEGDLILEPFGGTFSACRWALQNKRDCIGIEINKDIFDIGKKSLEVYINVS